MTDNNPTEARPPVPTAESQQEAAQPAEATSTAKASDELTEDALEAVAGGRHRLAWGVNKP